MSALKTETTAAAPGMRACVFTMDLGTIRGRENLLRRRLVAASGVENFSEVVFLGLRQTGPLPDGSIGHRPHVCLQNYSSARVANTLFRLVDTNALPRSAARCGLWFSGEAITESILACDPDIVMLDVTWARYLHQLLRPKFPGIIESIFFESGETDGFVVSDATRTEPFVRAADASGDSKVSIVLPTYNGTKYLAQSIQSCLGQCYRNLEVIVVDDGSGEEVSRIVAGFDDPRLVYVRHDVNRGLPAALNTGFSIATGAFLTWTSDDNYYAPDAIGRLARFLRRHPSVSFVYTSMFIVNELSNERPWRVRHPLPPDDLAHQNSVGGCFMYTREVYEAIGEYDCSAPLVEDYDYWVRVASSFRMQRLLTPLYYYRYHDKSLTSLYSADEVARRFDLVRRRTSFQSDDRLTGDGGQPRVIR